MSSNYHGHVTIKVTGPKGTIETTCRDIYSELNLTETIKTSTLAAVSAYNEIKGENDA